MSTAQRSDHTDLPAALTPLIGREREIAAVTGLLRDADVRLVTLTGPGGVGKTRLALATAADAADAFSDGIRLVGLAPVAAPNLVAPTIAQALGVRETGDAPLIDRLVAFLRDRAVLLILDNFEQVVEAAPLVAELLSRCHGLTILVTSRVRLRLTGEREQIVPPLGLARPDEMTATGAERSEAVRLFVARAHAVQDDFVLSAENAPIVAEICRRLDGLPLAIELAAARVKVLSPATLLVRLDRRLPLLTGGSRDLPARQQTMRDTIAWSYDLLPTEEQILFRRLSVFVGGCTLEAAEAVAESGRRKAVEMAADDLSGLRPLSPSVLDEIAALIDASLLRSMVVPGGIPRYVMLETVREFGLEQLEAHGEDDAARDAHAALFLTFVEPDAPPLFAEYDPEWHDLLAADHDNLRAAINWLCVPDTAAACLRLVAACASFWYTWAHIREGTALLDRALAIAGPEPTAAKATALRWAADFALVRGDLDGAATFGRASMAVSDALGDRRGRAAALHLIAMVEERRFHWDTAISLFEEELAIWRELGEARPMGLALWLLSGALYSRGDVVQARAAVDEAAAIFRQIGHRYWEVMSLSYLGMFAATEGRFAEAVHHYRASLGGLAGLGEVTFFHKPLPALAELALVGGDPTNAARLLGAVDVRVERTSAPVMPFDVPMYERARAGATTALGEQAFATARAEGRELSTADLLVLADVVVDAVEAAARMQGRRHAASTGGLTPREQVVVRLIATGKTDAEIADALFISPRTVNAHVANILGKLGVSSRGDAVARARDLGLLVASATSSRYT